MLSCYPVRYSQRSPRERFISVLLCSSVCMTPVIKAVNLRKQFDEVVAVAGINFSIEEGECFGFLGPNGAGKSTTMRMIYCVSPLTSGTLNVLGMDVSEDRQREIKALIGVVPQENNLDADFTVHKNLTVYARYFQIDPGLASKRADELIDFMQLKEKRDSKIDELSGGLKRRLIIARALINDPRILILDEPTTGLDPQARHLIWERVRELKKRKVTVILTTHYMDEAEQLCDRLIILDKGKIVAEGNPRDLIEKHVSSQVLEMIPPSDELIRLVTQNGWNFERYADRIFVYTDDSASVLAQIKGKVPLERSIIRNASLEDVFLKLTGRGLIE
jgi:lipooligosaccharide transport system ATP-binding protein